jgi:starch phosphorylase
VPVEHDDTAGVADAAEVGATLAVHAYVALGDLSVDDVEVQVVHGRPGADDDLLDQVTTAMHVAESYEGNRHRFDADVRLDRSGPFGYTVRAVPRNAALASVAELGLVSAPA